MEEGAVGPVAGERANRATFARMSTTDESTDEAVSGVELDVDQLSPEALRGLVEEFVTREGTEYGASDWAAMVAGPS